jgi:hypothetical protein
MELSRAEPRQGLIVSTLTPEAFAPFGFVIEPQPDGAPWRSGDAVLPFGGGPPRLYLMTLPCRGLAFKELARHRLMSLALGAMDDHAWFLVVVLHPGTWHAGPLFEGLDQRVFLNLESRTTNLDDRTMQAIGGGRHCVVALD